MIERNLPDLVVVFSVPIYFKHPPPPPKYTHYFFFPVLWKRSQALLVAGRCLWRAPRRPPTRTWWRSRLVATLKSRSSVVSIVPDKVYRTEIPTFNCRGSLGSIWYFWINLTSWTSFQLFTTVNSWFFAVIHFNKQAGAELGQVQVQTISFKSFVHLFN